MKYKSFIFLYLNLMLVGYITNKYNIIIETFLSVFLCKVMISNIHYSSNYFKDLLSS